MRTPYQPRPVVLPTTMVDPPLGALGAPTSPAPTPAEAYAQRWAALVALARRGNVDAFGTIVLRDQEDQPLDCAPLHQVFTTFVNYCWSQSPPLYAGVLAPWRHGKTLLGPIRLALHEIGQNPNIRIRLVCGDDREAVLRVAAIRRYLLSDAYKLVFPHIKPGRLADWTKHSLFVERTAAGPDPTLSSAGIFNAEAGGGNDIVMLDDVATYQNMILNAGLRPRVYETLTSVWLRRIDPATRVLCVGTTWHADDPYQLLMASGGQWRWLIIAVNDTFNGLTCRVC